MLTLTALSMFVATPSVTPHPEALPSLPDVGRLALATEMARRPSRNRGISIRIPPAAPGPPLPRILGPRDSASPLIMIDPGHGGHDPGARNARLGWPEKDLTLSIAKRVSDELLRGGRVRVALTREDDRFLALHERHGLARAMGAALFVSIHADASDETRAHGATIYTLSDVASDRDASRFAARENRADLVNGISLSGGGSAVESILADLTQRETLAASFRFAELLHRESADAIPFREPYHRRAALIVLKSPETPSVLFETGYISNDGDARWLESAAGQLKIAKGISRAVAVYVAARGVSGASSSSP